MEKNKTKIEILDWDLVATWSFDLKVETCTICRNHIMDLCIECQNDEKNGRCNVAWGKCGHAFHKHCIDRWLNTKNVCPLDTQVWQEEESALNDKGEIQ
ncbi:pip1 [Ecytonucleospora hepatopenaei]|uniref:Pip1 n=1 Tax=Ecytonucleospora hepatopenaei TaxID=646526 RepID=A0A1W0E710_9MICR|nr:pip1 [Ecytonucleospora hepatopenaei]